MEKIVQYTAPITGVIFAFFAFRPDWIINPEITFSGLPFLIVFPTVLWLMVDFVHRNADLALVPGLKTTVILFPNLIKGICQGILAALSVLSILVWYFWQNNPDNGALEPMFVGFGLSTAAMKLTLNRVNKLYFANAQPERV